jgi:hypothetical protein
MGREFSIVATGRESLDALHNQQLQLEIVDPIIVPVLPSGTA